MLQRDLGTTIVIVGSVFMMLFVAGARLRHLVVTGVFDVLGGLAYLIFGDGVPSRAVPVVLRPVEGPAEQRVSADPGPHRARDPAGGSGSASGASRAEVGLPAERAHRLHLRGVGRGARACSASSWCSSRSRVMIYAGIRIAMRAPDTFGRLLAAGITSWIGLQAIVNLGAVTGLLPITGVPLPFVSFGGSAWSSRSAPSACSRRSPERAPRRRPSPGRRLAPRAADRAPARRRRGGRRRERRDRRRRDGRSHLPRARVGGRVGSGSRGRGAVHRVARRAGGDARPRGRLPLRRESRRRRSSASCRMRAREGAR